MSIMADSLIDRIKLKAQLTKWRIVAIIALSLLVITLISKSSDFALTGNYIARISLEGILTEDKERDNAFKAIADNNNIKAVVLYINSPGGTMTGGEQIFGGIRKIADKKPVVAVMGGVAASGGYMSAVAADYIVAMKSTLTGSIGVLLQTAEVTGLAEKVGVKFITFKSGPLKGEPSPFEKLSPEVANSINNTIKDSYDVFVDMVATQRKMPKDEVIKLADGRIYTGRQALDKKLVDKIGGEEDALMWLYTERGIDKDMKVRDEDIYPEQTGFEKMVSSLAGSSDLFSRVNNGSIMALWDNAL